VEAGVQSIHIVKQIFFIAGYPRSRSAWMATLLTWGDSFCFHDGLADIESLDELDRKFHSVPGNIAGNSDPANLLFHEELKERYPEAIWFYIHRELSAAQTASTVAFGSHAEKINWNAMMDVLNNDSGYNVSYESLNSIKTLRAIIEIVGITMPDQRIRELMRLNIQVQPELLKNIPNSTIGKMAKLYECVLA
jgi:hypothetical protein